MSSKIEWTEDTWNPLLGCDKISAGCKNCYAIQTAWIRMHNPKMKERYAGVVEKTANGSLNWTGKINMVESALLKPLKTKKPTTYFVNSMSDLFHKDVPVQFIARVFAIMFMTPQHTYQVLTKRASIMSQVLNDTGFLAIVHNNLKELFKENAVTICELIECWPLKNVWLGVSVEDQKAAEERIPFLMRTPAAIRFLSCEPLLGPVDITNGALNNCYSAPTRFNEINGKQVGTEWTDPGDKFIGLDWVICGGESGKDARPMNPEWAKSLRDQCTKTRVPFFFKQWGDWRYSGGNSRKENIGAWEGEKLQTVGMDAGESDGVHVMIKTGKAKAGRELEGRIWNEYPA